MGVRYGIAKSVARMMHWGLTRMARRPGATLPGKVAIKIDPRALEHARSMLRCGSIMVTGTNGKTTVNNLLADCLEQAGLSVCCNRTGANLINGITSALLTCKGVDWAVIESDELWIRKTLPALQPRYLVLLNLFRDQLDRCGEIDHIQDVLVEALRKSPQTMLIFNADDPLCAWVAQRAAALPERTQTRSISFGVGEPMNLEQNAVSDTTMCQLCNGMLEYEVRQYGQLGAYRCPQCGFERPALDFEATDIRFARSGLRFNVSYAMPKARDIGHELCTQNVSRETNGALRGIQNVNDGLHFECNAEAKSNVLRETCEDAALDQKNVSRETFFPIQTHLAGSYMVYNMLAVAATATSLGCTPAEVQAALDAFDPHNGRLQEFLIGEHRTLLNLAKNPTGFNQNLRIVVQQATADECESCAIAFFINDGKVDGQDISWIWDIDFEELNRVPYARVFAGGTRRRDLQVRLKYAGVNAQLIDNMADVFASIDALPHDAPVYAIANYTALAPVHAELNSLQAHPPLPSTVSCETIGTSNAEASNTHQNVNDGLHLESNSSTRDANTVSCEANLPLSMRSEMRPVVIAHLFPDLLNLYGDGGNVRILEQRLRWRGIPVEVHRVEYGERIDLDEVDLLFLGGGPDREQELAAEQLMNMRDDIARFVENGGATLAICGGYQLLGRTWLSSKGEVPGLGILDIETRRAGSSTDRLIDNIALESPIAKHPVIGYENHASRTYLGERIEPFGRVISNTGHGNNDNDQADGACYRNVLGTYLHGTLLAKNPEVADWLLERALARNAARADTSVLNLEPLDDTIELAANDEMAAQLIH